MTTNDLRELFLDLNVKFDEELKKYTNTKTEEEQNKEKREEVIKE